MKQRRILYVEDNPNNMLLMSRILQVDGHQLLEAKNGDEGWNVAYTERPDLIFMDLMMPGIDGFELARKIKSTPELSHIPIMVLTAYGDPEIERKAKEAGCDGFLHKPADIRQIQAVLRQFLDDPILHQ
jgi:two-component system cell cycle response regulator DivK